MADHGESVTRECCIHLPVCAHNQARMRPYRCDFTLYGNRCTNAAQFRLVTDGGEVERRACGSHFDAIAVDLRGTYQSHTIRSARIAPVSDSGGDAR